VSREFRLRAYAKLIRHTLGMCAALWELITGEVAPPAREVLARENGH